MPDAGSDNLITIDLEGRIDSNNASAVEEKLLSQVEGKSNASVRIKADKLEYISSAGLRVLLHLKKTNPNLSITGVNPEVYEVFEMTGFTQMMNVEKAYRVVSVEGCEEIGRGANGTIYRIDQDNVVKVYNNADALEEIQHEREVARLALVLGIPTSPMMWYVWETATDRSMNCSTPVHFPRSWPLNRIRWTGVSKSMWICSNSSTALSYRRESYRT